MKMLRGQKPVTVLWMLTQLPLCQVIRMACWLTRTTILPAGPVTCAPWCTFCPTARLRCPTLSDCRIACHGLTIVVAQAYSSLLYDGPTIHSVFNGVYKVAFDYNENEETKAWVDTFVESEQANGPNTHLLPTKVTDRPHTTIAFCEGISSYSPSVR